MTLINILITFVALSQALFVLGLHTIASAPVDPNYRGNRVVARTGLRHDFPTRVGYADTTQNRRPRFHASQTIQQPLPDARVYRPYLRHYQNVQSRNIIRPVYPQPFHRQFVERPHVHFHQDRPSLGILPVVVPEPINIPKKNKGMQHLTEVPRSDMTLNNFGRQHPQQVEKNTLIELLEKRRSVLRDENDAALIRKHLNKINDMRANSILNKDQILDKQVEYIENITDADIKREVLKIFVKDMVEKSGFLSQNMTNVQDVNALRILVDNVSSVTEKFLKLAHNVAVHPRRTFTGSHTTDINLHETSTTTDHPGTSPENGLRQRIISAISNYDRSAHISNRRNDSMESITQTFQRRARPDKPSDVASQPGAGMSIFGDIGTGTSTVQDQTIEIKRGKQFL